MRAILLVLTITLAFISQVKAEPLSIGNVMMGANIDKVIKDKNNKCRIEGMMVKYETCSYTLSHKGIEMYAQLYFAIENHNLEKMDLIFDKDDYDDIKFDLSQRYTYGANVFESFYDGNSVVEYIVKEGNIVLEYSDRQESCSLQMMSTNGQMRYEKETGRQFHRE